MKIQKINFTNFATIQSTENKRKNIINREYSSDTVTFTQMAKMNNFAKKQKRWQSAIISIQELLEKSKRLINDTTYELSEKFIGLKKVLSHTEFQNDGIKIQNILDYDTVSKKPFRLTEFQEDGTSLKQIAEFSNDGNLKKLTFYRDNGKTIDSTLEFNTDTDSPLKATVFFADGKTVKSILDYNPETKLITKQTDFREDGITRKGEWDFNTTTGKAYMYFQLNRDGRTLDFMKEL